MDEKERVMTKLSFSMVSSPGVYALLLGSGVSRSANINTGWQITVDLARQCVLRNGIKTEEELLSLNDAEFERWYVDEYGQDLRYDELLNSVSQTPTERRNLLNSYFEPTDEDREDGYKIPQDAHKAIARLAKSGHIKVILTTNFDRLIEQALEEEGVVVHPLYTPSQIVGREPLVHLKPGHCYVVKINGDYRDSNIKNTPEELDKLTRNMPFLLKEIFGSFGLIVCGWSADYDTALVRTIEEKSSRRYATYWTKFDSELEPKAKELVAHLDAETIPIKGADDFFNELCSSVNTLSKYEQSGKVSLDAVIGKVKKNIQVKNRIGLYDEINRQFSIFNEGIASDIFEIDTDKLRERGVDIPISDAFIRERMIDYLELVRPLCTILSSIVYYHGENFDSNITGAIENANILRENRSSLDPLFQLQTYPALLLQYSLGIVALSREDWPLLRSIAYDVSDSKPGGLGNDILPGKSILRLTPGIICQDMEWSDSKVKKLLDDFRDDLYSILNCFFPNRSQFNDLFQIIEFIFSLAALDQYPNSDEADYRVRFMNNYLCYFALHRKKYYLSHFGFEFDEYAYFQHGIDITFSDNNDEKITFGLLNLPAFKFFQKQYQNMDSQFGFMINFFRSVDSFNFVYQNYIEKCLKDK